MRSCQCATLDSKWSLSLDSINWEFSLSNRFILITGTEENGSVSCQIYCRHTVEYQHRIFLLLLRFIDNGSILTPRRYLVRITVVEITDWTAEISSDHDWQCATTKGVFWIWNYRFKSCRFYQGMYYVFQPFHRLTVPTEFISNAQFLLNFR